MVERLSEERVREDDEGASSRRRRVDQTKYSNLDYEMPQPWRSKLLLIAALNSNTNQRRMVDAAGSSLFWGELRPLYVSIIN